jgi:hypothetical protein
VSLGKHFLTFRKIVLTTWHFSLRLLCLVCLTLKSGDATVLRNVGNYLFSGTPSHTNRFRSNTAAITINSHSRFSMWREYIKKEEYIYPKCHLLSVGPIIGCSRRLHYRIHTYVHTYIIYTYIHTFLHTLSSSSSSVRSPSYKSIDSSKASSPLSAIKCFRFQTKVPSCYLQVIQ